MSMRIRTRTDRPRTKGMTDPFNHFSYLVNSSPDHDAQINGVEKWCKSILGRAGLPTDPSAFYNPETGEQIDGALGGRLYSLVQMVSAARPWPDRTIRSYSFNSPEGFAARILLASYQYRRLFEEDKIQQAFYYHSALWLLVGKAEEKLPARASRVKGGKNSPKAKPKVGIQQVANKLVKKHPDWSAKRIWRNIVNFGSIEIKMGKQKFIVYHDGGVLIEKNDITGQELSITSRSFERYVKRAKARLRK